MSVNIGTLLFVSTGAFFYWMISGFKGRFNDYMSRYVDRDSKFYKNLATGFLIIFILVIVLVKVFG